MILLALFVVFIAPVIARGLWWVAQDRPVNWRAADWSSTGLLPPARSDPEPSVRVYAARTGGVKGIIAVHSWIVLKERGGAYERYDVVGWGSPVRRNGYPPDARWYSNPPELLLEAKGASAEAALPRLKAAIAEYRFRRHGDYRIWPGPNSNTFVAHVLAAAPELGLRLPPTAIGRDFPLYDGWVFRAPGGGVTATMGGIAGITLGWAEGIEVNLFGLVAGLDIRSPALLLPGIGRVDLRLPAG